MCTLFRNLRGIRVLGKLTNRTLSTSCKNQDRWQLMSAVCLERFPVVSQDMNSEEKKFHGLMTQIEDEYSHLSLHEMRYIDDEIFQKRREEDDYEETEATATYVFAAEAEEQWEADANKFTASPCTTAADTKEDKHSPERCLHRKLVLVVKKKIGESPLWCLPQAAWQEGESLRQTAERSLYDLCGDKLKVKFSGNAPCGLYQYNYPSSVREQGGYTGAKIFLFKAQYKEGKVEQNEESVEDHLWLRKDELKDRVHPRYYNTLNKVIMEL